jgi:hypothetical protein
MSAGGNYNHALDAVLARSASDRAFRQALLTNPRAAIRDAFGIEIPVTFRIKFVERDADLDALVVLPDLQSSDVELSDDALESVSGGVEPPTYNFAWSDDPDNGGG